VTAKGLASKAWKRKGRRLKTTEPTNAPIMSIRMGKLDRIFAQFHSKLTESQDERHLAFNSLQTNVCLMAQELLKVKTGLKAVWKL